MTKTLAVADQVRHRPPIIIYSATPWDGIWRPRREYAEQLAKRGWPVIYTTGPMSIWDRGSDDWRRATWFGRVVKYGSLIIEKSGRFPFRWPGRALDVPVLSWHAHTLKSTLDSKGWKNLIAIVFDPAFLPHVLRLRPRHTVYFQYEALARLPGARWRFQELEHELVQHSSLIISLTAQMAEVMPGSGAARAKILPSAVRIEHFLNAEMRPCPEDMAGIPHPRIGYVGSITIALNFDLMLDVVRARPDWQFVFIGPVESDGGSSTLRDPICDAKWQALRALPNVHYLAQKPAADVPAYMAHMDVNALWYRTDGDGWWLLGSPIKLYENLAVGKPVVGTSLSAVCDFSAVVELADTADEWLAALSRVIYEETRSGSQERRISIARENSWSNRTDLLESWLLDMISCRELPPV